MIQLDANGLPILDQFSEEGFVDLVFQITEFKDDGEGYRFHLAASHDAKQVGIGVEMVKGIQGGLHEDEDEELQLVAEHVYRGGVKFFRSGVDSDELISALCVLYELRSENLRMVDNQTFTAIALHEGALDFETMPVKIKLFGNDEEHCSEDEYFECFFNVDFASGLVFWNEKDPDYREPLVNALGIKTGP